MNKIKDFLNEVSQPQMFTIEKRYTYIQTIIFKKDTKN